MALSKRHTGFGKWAVYDDGSLIAERLTKEQAEARILAPPALPKGDRGREYIERMNADMNKPIKDELALIRAVVCQHHDEDETNVIMRQVEPILKAGKQGGRRERKSFILPAKAA